MKLETKFNVHDVVYVIEKNKYTYEDCDVCENKGKIIYKNQEYLCPECHGERKRINKVYWQVKQFTINEIIISIKNNGIIYVRYRFKNNEYDSKYEYNIYKTQAEAQAECDRRNAL